MLFSVYIIEGLSFRQENRYCSSLSLWPSNLELPTYASARVALLPCSRLLQVLHTLIVEIHASVTSTASSHHNKCRDMVKMRFKCILVYYKGRIFLTLEDNSFFHIHAQEDLTTLELGHLLRSKFRLSNVIGIFFTRMMNKY